MKISYSSHQCRLNYLINNLEGRTFFHISEWKMKNVLISSNIFITASFLHKILYYANIFNYSKYQLSKKTCKTENMSMIIWSFEAFVSQWTHKLIRECYNNSHRTWLADYSVLIYLSHLNINSQNSIWLSCEYQTTF